MINLLPFSEKQRLRKQLALRAGSVFFAIAAILFSLGAALLAPSVLLVAGKEKNEEERVAFVSKNTSSETEREALLLDTREVERRRIILENNSFFEISPLVAVALAHKAPGVRITGFLYEKGAEKKGAQSEKFIIEGVSPSREALVSFARALENDASFADVELPVGNLVQSRDIPFSLGMHISL